MDLPDSLESIAWTCGGHHAVSLVNREYGDVHGEHGDMHEEFTADPTNAMKRTEADLIMAIAHKRYPHFGLQFHPESICTKYGYQLLHNFYQLSQQYNGRSSLYRYK
jgi:anthranilate/para-aminobenzoate synthase component II